MSDHAPQQNEERIAEIRERHYEPLFGTPEKRRSINDYMDWNQDAIRDLLAALDAERARADALREVALQGIRNQWTRIPKLDGETPETRLDFLLRCLSSSSTRSTEG